jgi:uncharacterized protein YjbI with pentapeptide repeats
MVVFETVRLLFALAKELKVFCPLFISLAAICMLVGCEDLGPSLERDLFEKKHRQSAFMDLKTKNGDGRMPGMQQLEALVAGSDKNDFQIRDSQIRDELVAYVRDRQSLPTVKVQIRSASQMKSHSLRVPLLPDDIQAALTILTQSSWFVKAPRAYRINLANTDLRGAYLRKGFLKGAILSGSLLRSANLSMANLQGAVLKNVDLRGADLTQANFQGATLWQANMCSAMLMQADFKETKLWAAKFENAHLVAVNFEKADLGSVDLDNANLERARLTHANLGRSTLRQSNLQQSDLKGAFLGWADMRGAFLKSANLRNANLKAADLRGALGVNTNQLCRSLTLYQTRMSDTLAEQIWQNCPHKFRKPKG